jgi:hypothetical protein
MWDGTLDKLEQSPHRYHMQKGRYTRNTYCNLEPQVTNTQ